MQGSSFLDLIISEQSVLTSIDTGMLRVRRANQVIKEAAELADPTLLFDCLIIQGELIILFADTGIGKTIFAVQIGIYVAKTGIIVLYIDLELSDKQFEKRYKDEFGNHYVFPDGFFRADYTPIFSLPQNISYEEYFIGSLENSIEQSGAQMVIIDNMTKLSSGDTDSAKNTIPVMESLSRLKRDKGITFLVLEHNKKVDSTQPISLNHLQGSKFKSNFADSVFSIGRCAQDKKMRYVKQLKVRSAELVYDTENVRTYEISTRRGALFFEPLGYGNEFTFLKHDTQSTKSEKRQQAMELKSQGLNNSEIGEQLGVTEGTVRYWFKPTKS